MRRAILRFLGLVSLAAGLVSAVIDLVATPAQQGVMFRTLGAHWLRMHEASLQDINAILNANGPSPLWTGFLLPILSQPAIVVFGCLAVLFLALALLLPRRRHEHDPRHH